MVKQRDKSQRLMGLVLILPGSRDYSDAPNLPRHSPNEFEDSQIANDLEGPESGLTNPLSTGPPAFMSAENGRTCMYDDSMILNRGKG